DTCNPIENAPSSDDCSPYILLRSAHQAPGGGLLPHRSNLFKSHWSNQWLTLLLSYELLQAVAQRNAATLQAGLQQLVTAELLCQRGTPPQAIYSFKHALVRDTAYQSLLRSKRQQLHQQVAQVLETRFAETVAMQPELVAQHYTEASLVGQALPYWQQAGQRAIARSANTEAIQHLTTALDLLKTLPDTPERAQQELTLQVALGPALTVTKGWAAPEVEKTYTRARELCQQVGDTSQLFSVLWG